MNAPNPWTPEKRTKVKRRIDDEADLAAKRLGASHVTIIAFYEQGEYTHMMDGGTAPSGMDDVYKLMLSVRNILKESGGEDIKVQ